jgi:hypothetical protein
MFIYLRRNVLFFNPVSTNKRHIHRGQLLEAAVKASRHKVTVVIERAGYSRSSYYKHRKEKDLDFHILTRYGRALKHDFREDLPEMPKYMIEEPEEQYGKALTLQEAIRQRDQWKEKYYDLLELYHNLKGKGQSVKAGKKTG